MREHEARSPRWLGNPRQYQAVAARTLELEQGRTVPPWSWVFTECDVPLCLDVECMTILAPKRIKYPMGVCIYCGEPSGTKDHLLPEPSTGAALRGSVPVVPACADCNARINDFPSPNVSLRRKRAQLSIERKSRHLLLSPHKTLSDLREMGPTLRSVAVKNNGKRLSVKARLSWPDDPHYDLRAFQQSGIEDPVALGLCDGISTPLRPEYQEAS